MPRETPTLPGVIVHDLCLYTVFAFVVVTRDGSSGVTLLKMKIHGTKPCWDWFVVTFVSLFLTSSSSSLQFVSLELRS